MGGDGGVIATKRAYSRGVGKNSGREHKKDGRDINDEQSTRATTCALTNQKLVAPIVCCEMGNLYNKEALLTAILEKTLPEACSHIRGLKDVKTLEFTENQRHNGSSMMEEHVSLFICPVTMEVFNGIHPFYAIWSTGKVLSDKAVKEMGIDALQVEYGPFSANDMVKLLPHELELNDQRAAMHHRRELQPIKKKKDKRQKNEGIEEDEEIITNKKTKNSEASTNMLKLSSAESIVTSATSNIKENGSKSEIYKSLFHKDMEKDKKDRDLFMSVAGIRYTL